MEEASEVYAPWEEWDPKDYLDEYYQEVEPDEFYLMEFLVEVAGKLPPVGLVLDYGCGPTVHRLFPLVPKAREIHLAEYLPANREAVRRWKAGAENAHDWTPFLKETLRLEGYSSPLSEAVRAREDETRRRVTEIFPTDASLEDPLGPERRGCYPMVTTHYCADGATDNLETWKRFMRNIAGLVEPGGIFITSSIIASDRYKVGSRWYPSPGVTERDVLDLLETEGFIDVDLRAKRVSDRGHQGYEGVMFAIGSRRA
jgi:hypothetical protein